MRLIPQVNLLSHIQHPIFQVFHSSSKYCPHICQQTFVQTKFNSQYWSSMPRQYQKTIHQFYLYESHTIYQFRILWLLLGKCSILQLVIMLLFLVQLSSRVAFYQSAGLLDQSFLDSSTLLTPFYIYLMNRYKFHLLRQFFTAIDWISKDLHELNSVLLYSDFLEAPHKNFFYFQLEYDSFWEIKVLFPLFMLVSSEQTKIMMFNHLFLQYMIQKYGSFLILGMMPLMNQKKKISSLNQHILFFLLHFSASTCGKLLKNQINCIICFHE